MHAVQAHQAAVNSARMLMDSAQTTIGRVESTRKLAMDELRYLKTERRLVLKDGEDTADIDKEIDEQTAALRSAKASLLVADAALGQSQERLLAATNATVESFRRASPKPESQNQGDAEDDGDTIDLTQTVATPATRTPAAVPAPVTANDDVELGKLCSSGDSDSDSEVEAEVDTARGDTTFDALVDELVIGEVKEKEKTTRPSKKRLGMGTTATTSSPKRSKTGAGDYAVRILRHRWHTDSTREAPIPEYFVHWVGWPASADCWITEE